MKRSAFGSGEMEVFVVAGGVSFFSFFFFFFFNTKAEESGDAGLGDDSLQSSDF